MGDKSQTERIIRPWTEEDKIEKGCPSINISLTMLTLVQLSDWYHPPTKGTQIFFILFHSFSFFPTHIGSHRLSLQGYSLWKLSQSFFNPYGLYVACHVAKGFEGFWKKGYKGSKDCAWVFYYFVTKIINLILWKTIQAFAEITPYHCHHFFLIFLLQTFFYLWISSLNW